MLCAPAQPRRTPIEAFLPLLASRAPGELHAFAALAHMLSDKLPPDYARQLVTAGTGHGRRPGRGPGHAGAFAAAQLLQWLLV